MAGGMSSASAPAGPGLKGKMRRKLPNSFKIQVTSMVDMFVILLVFLLKSFSTSPIQVTPTKDLRLPSSISPKDPVDVVKLVVSKTGIYVEDNKIIDLNNGELNKAEIDGTDDKFIPTLYKTLDEQAKKMKDIAKQNQAVEFDGRVLLQADKDLSFHLLKKVMYTSMIAGYADVKIAVSE